MRTPSKQVLDFLVVGAQKAGTTSLFEYLRAHPDVYLPPAKEVPFFSYDKVYAKYGRRVDRYIADVFARAPGSKLWGTATPSYMAGSLIPELLDPSDQERLLDAPDTETIVPTRIRNQLPRVKLIAILRNPIDRALSSHQMYVMRRLEERSFTQAIEEALDPSALERARRLPAVTDSYVVLGEYGRILQGYFEIFPREQIRVIFTDDLENDPERTVADLFEYLGVDPTFVPPNLGRRYLVGSSERRLPWLDFYRLQKATKRHEPLRRLWHGLPSSVRARAVYYYSQVSFRVFQWNRVSGQSSNERPLPSGTGDALARHYIQDGVRLEKLLGRTPPWLPAFSAPKRARQ